MGNIKFILFLIIMVFPIGVSALNVEIEMKDSFSLEDVVTFNYVISSDTPIEVIYTDYIRCFDAPIATSEYKNVFLNPEKPLQEVHNDFVVTKDINPQNCTANVRIFSPLQQKIEKTFEIKTNPSFDFYIVLDKKIFLLNENINLNYESEVENPIIQTTLIYPNKQQNLINLPYSFKVDQIGTYSLEVTASKEGYKTKALKEQFAVIKKEAEIKLVQICNANNICEEPRENKQNCPQDCVKKEIKVKKMEISFDKYYLIPIVILIIIGYWLYKKKVK